MNPRLQYHQLGLALVAISIVIIIAVNRSRLPATLLYVERPSEEETALTSHDASGSNEAPINLAALKLFAGRLDDLLRNHWWEPGHNILFCPWNIYPLRAATAIGRKRLTRIPL